MRTVSTKLKQHIWFGLLVVALLFITAQQTVIAQQWSGPDGNGNVSSTNSGNIGIGTASPDAYAKLHVYQAPSAGLDIQSANTGGWSRLRLVTGTHAYGWFAGDATQPDAPNKIGLFDYTLNAFRMMIDSSGNVGIGTTTPGYGLEVNKTSGSGGSGWSAFFREGGKNGVLIGSRGSGNAVGTISGALSDLSNVSDLSLNPFGGNVGIGTLTPGASYRLDVNGNTNVTGNMNATGTITGGNIIAKYQDVAEWVESSQALPAGTVVVLDHTKSNQVVSSTQSYDTRVAGVISAQPGIALGESGEKKVLVATTGRVRVKVEATQGPIQIGDLLVTSDTPGLAMKSEPVKLGGVELHRPGTLIGKALEPLAKGTGEILVLLSLQ